MFKFAIDYVFENGGEAVRSGTVFAEDLEKAVEKIKAVDPEYSDVRYVSFAEKPNWRKAEE